MRYTDAKVDTKLALRTKIAVHLLVKVRFDTRGHTHNKLDVQLGLCSTRVTISMRLHGQRFDRGGNSSTDASVANEQMAGLMVSGIRHNCGRGDLYTLREKGIRGSQARLRTSTPSPGVDEPTNLFTTASEAGAFGRYVVKKVTKSVGSINCPWNSATAVRA
jgi:hypothetical protein